MKPLTIKKFFEVAGVDVTQGKAKLLVESMDWQQCSDWVASHENVFDQIVDLMGDGSKEDVKKARDFIASVDPSLDKTSLRDIVAHFYHEIFMS